MTDETATPAEDNVMPWDPASDPDGYTREEVVSKDWYLNAVLDMTIGRKEEAGGSISLTVTSNGLVVSGLAIGRSEWVEGVGSQYEQATGDRYVRELFDVANEKNLEERRRREDADLPAAARMFLHMKDVRVGTENSWSLLPFWRGALSDITGWSLGSWNPLTDSSAPSEAEQFEYEEGPLIP